MTGLVAVCNLAVGLGVLAVVFVLVRRAPANWRTGRWGKAVSVGVALLVSTQVAGVAVPIGAVVAVLRHGGVCGTEPECRRPTPGPGGAPGRSDYPGLQSPWRRRPPRSAGGSHRPAMVRTLRSWRGGEHVRIAMTADLSDPIIAEFASEVFALVKGCVGPHQASVVHTMLGELLDNTITHAQGPVGAYGAAQVYTGKTSGQAGIEVAIADPGIGILRSLHKNPRYAALPDSSTAIQRSLHRGASEGAHDTSSPGGQDGTRGNGLTDIVRQLQSQQGVLLLRSGDGVGRVIPRHRRFSTTTSATPGTWAWLRLNPADSLDGPQS